MSASTFTIWSRKNVSCAVVWVVGAFVSVPALAEGKKVTGVDLLSQRAPAPILASSFSANRLLGVAFQPEDLKALLDASGSASCFASSEKLQIVDSAGRGASRACVAAVEQTYYERIAFANDRFSQGLLPNYAPNALDASFIQHGAISRMSTRLITRAVSQNEFLKVLVEGKVDVSFSLRDLGGVTQKFEKAPEPRPAYVLAVKYRDPHSQANVKVAAVGNSVFAGLKPASHSLRDLPIAEKQIVESWPEAKPVVSAPVVNTSGDDRLTKVLQKRLGLSAEPFSQFRLRLERAPGSTSLSAFALRLEDSSGLANLDLTGLMQGHADGVAYQMRLPYKQHSALMTADNLTMKNRYVYEYAATATLRTRVAYDPNTAVGAVPNAWAGKYSVGFSLAF